MMCFLTSINGFLSKMRCVGQAIVGLRGRKQDVKQSLNEAYTNALDAASEPLEKTPSLTTESPSSQLGEYYLDWGSGHLDSSLIKQDGKFSASPATKTSPSEKTMQGGRKDDAEKVRLDLISPLAVVELGKVLTFGAKKYADHNWRRGISYSRILGAILRHVYAYMSGETKDSETGLSHIAHAMCEAMFLLEFEKTHPEMDDRYKG